MKTGRPRGAVDFFILLLSALAFVLGGFVFYAEHKLSRMALGGLGESFSTKLYSAPFILKDGVAPPPARLIARLERLSYSRVPAAPAIGQYSWNSYRLDVGLRGFKIPSPGQEAGVFALSWDGGRWSIVSSSGTGVPQAALEPELAAELSGPKKIRREPAEAAEIPEKLKQAVIAVEDRRFYKHHGIDLRAIARAFWSNATGRGVMQGGSTITQQLSKNLFLSPKRNFRRKAAEALLALYLELRYGKERILTIYLNHIYLGQDGPVSVAGVKAGAKFYFGKDLSLLSLPECATLAGLIRSPQRYNPFRDLASARGRRDVVLARMKEEGMISPVEHARAITEPLIVHRPVVARAERRDGDYFTAEVIRELTPRYGEDALYRDGLSIYTTMDPLLQKSAQRAVEKAKPQGALVALDPQEGRVLALSGGRDFGESQFNRATQAARQPGSAFKPFVYGAALEKGFTPATILHDVPRSFPRQLQGAATTWNPANYDGIYRGTTTLRQGLALSLNAATLDLAEKTGITAVLDFARRLGMENKFEDSLATMLGAGEVNLLELTAAYAAFDNGGFRVHPSLVAAVFDAEGAPLELEGFTRQPAISPALSYLICSLLQSTVSEGTARSLPLLGFDRPAAGKTGTTNDGRDAWFVGFTPQVLTGVWVGDDQHKKLNATGAKNALPVWAAFMRDASEDFPPEGFLKPSEGLVSVTIDPASGLRARSGCPQRREESFIEGTQPSEDCPLHQGGVMGWFKRWFNH